MQVVYAPLGAQLLPTPPTVYKGFTYWVHGQIDAYRYVICPPKGEGKGPIISDSAYQSIIVANQEARRAIDLCESILSPI